MSIHWPRLLRIPLTIRRCVGLLVVLVATMGISTIVWLHLLNAQIRRTEAVATDYHLAAVLRLNRIEEELARFQSDFLLVHLQLDHGIEPPPSADPDLVLGPNLSLMLYTVSENLAVVSELQGRYGDPAFDNGLQRLVAQVRLLKIAMDDLDVSADSDLDVMLRQFAHTITISTQLRRLHRITHRDLDEALADRERNGFRDFAIFLAVLLILGGLLGYRLFTLIGEILRDQRRATEALRESESSLKALVEGVQTAIVVHDGSGEIVLSNQTARKLLEPLATDIDGRQLSDPTWRFFDEDGIEMPVEEYPVSRILETKEAIDGLLLSLRELNGSEMLWLLVNGIPIIDKNGHLSKVIVSFVDITQRKRIEEEREKAIIELREALEDIKTLHGIIPICAHCKKIRDDEGYWHQVEVYVRDHSDAEFSHSLCAECMKELYPEEAGEILGGAEDDKTRGAS